MAIKKPSYLIAGVVIGACIGIFETLVVNLALVEISISPFFSLYFGVLFLVVGGLIFFRVHNHEQLYADQVRLMSENRVFATEGKKDKWLSPEKHQRLFLLGFAGTIIFSGFLCFLLDKHMFAGLASWLKIPLYGILGLSIAFALTFSVVDVLNYLLGFLQEQVAKPLVESTTQVYLVVASSVVMGAIFGFTFGMLGVMDESIYHIRVALMQEENYCYPIGTILGAATGFGNEYIRQQEDYSYAEIGHTQFDDDI